MRDELCIMFDYVETTAENAKWAALVVQNLYRL